MENRLAMEVKDRSGCLARVHIKIKFKIKKKTKARGRTEF
jgi:hypothetical protein